VKCDLSKCKHIDDLEEEVLRLRLVIQRLRQAIHDIAHGEQSGRHFANTVLAETCDDGIIANTPPCVKPKGD